MRRPGWSALELLVVASSGWACLGPQIAPPTGSWDGPPSSIDSPRPDAGHPAPAPSLIDNPLAPMPTDLKDVGLYLAFPDVSQTHTRALFFTPRYPLWSNGLDKVRHALIPHGAKIDTAKRDAWDFPVGSLFFKSFSGEDPTQPGAARFIETRIIRRIATGGELHDQWEFHVYEWNSAGTAATLVDLNKRIPREAIVDGRKFTHNVPSKKDCWNCHIANKAPIIGFDELRLNARIGSAADTQLAQVVARGWLTRAPSAPLMEVTGRTPLETSALEYLQANCAHCHNGEPPLEPGARYPALDLRHDQAVKNTVRVPTMSVGTKTGMRIVPGDPTNSVLWLALDAIGRPIATVDVKPMPNVGVDLADHRALALLRDWIRSLPP